WVAVPTGYKSSWAGSSTDASRCVKTAISFPLAIASSIRRTELSRATASGMKELGNRTVSRNGSTGSSAGIDIGRSPSEISSALVSSDCSWSLMVSPEVGRLYLKGETAGGREWGSATPAEPVQGRRTLHVEEQRRGTATLGHLALALLGNFPRLSAILAADG